MCSNMWVTAPFPIFKFIVGHTHHKFIHLMETYTLAWWHVNQLCHLCDIIMIVWIILFCNLWPYIPGICIWISFGIDTFFVDKCIILWLLLVEDFAGWFFLFVSIDPTSESFDSVSFSDWQGYHTHVVVWRHKWKK